MNAVLHLVEVRKRCLAGVHLIVGISAPVPDFSPVSYRLACRYAVVVASISPQARASLAERCGLTPLETQARLLSFLRGEGVQFLLDSSLAADFSLLEAGEEFVQRYRSVIEEGIRPPWAAPPPTVALSSTRRFNIESGREEGVSSGLAQVVSPRGSGAAPAARGRVNGSGIREGSASSRAGRAETSGAGVPHGSGELLVLTSACPGWVCYAEKTAPEALPCMSTVKSPQQVCTLVVMFNSKQLCSTSSGKC